ncbi:MAG TPA: hypothetical protein VFC54_14665 [Pseudolabrys sp.]|nr:hypothetical protein [Pseudolabrys sp.]
MIVKSLVGLSLVLNVSLDVMPRTPPQRAAWAQFSARHFEAALLPLVKRATDCIVRQVASDPRYTHEIRSDEINDLIIDSIGACERPVRAMIKAHDRMFGAGSGEAFLLGPYLDVLPAAVVQQVKVK